MKIVCEINFLFEGIYFSIFDFIFSSSHEEQNIPSKNSAVTKTKTTFVSAKISKRERKKLKNLLFLLPEKKKKLKN